MAYKVLLIDDNTDGRELFGMMVRHLGFDVLHADDGELGVQKAQSAQPDMIFMDLGMPNMGGMDALACLKASASTQDIPIVIYTAWIDQRDRDAALRLGVRDIVIKPVAVDRLQNILLRHLPNPTSAMELQ